MRKLEPLHTLIVCKMMQLLWKQYSELPKNETQSQRFHFWVYIQKEGKQGETGKDVCTLRFTVAL